MKKWQILFLIALIPMAMSGQTKVDSLKSELNKTSDDSTRVYLLILMWESTAYVDPDEAREYALQALEIAKKSNYKRGIADAYQRIASGFTVRNINDSAQFYYDKSLSIYEELNDPRMVGVILTNIAMVYYDQGEYVKALLKTEESLKKSSEANDQHGIAVTLQLLGNINYFMGNFEEAQKYFIQSLRFIGETKDRVRYADGLVYLASNYVALDKPYKALENLREAIAIYQTRSDSFYLAQAINNTGFIYYDLKKYDSAMLYFERSVTIASSTGNNAMMILGLNNMGLINKEIKNYKKSRAFFNEALSMAIKYNDQFRIAMISRNIGNILSAQNQYQQAISYYDTAILIGTKIGSKSSLKESYLSMSDAQAGLGNFKKSLDYFKLFEAMKDSLFNEDRTRKIEEMEARYEKEKSEKEITIQKSQIEILSKDLELQSIKQTLLIGGLIISLLLGIYIVMNLRNKMKRNRMIREQEKLLEVEKLKNAELQRDKYERELDFKKNELTSHALQMVQKNELLETLKEQIAALEKQSDSNARPGYRKLRFLINGSAQSDKEWENFNRHFEQVHQGFISSLKTSYPALTSNDLRLSAMMKLNLSSKEVAAIMNISPESVKKARYRLRKKLELPEEADLHSFMMNLVN